jgi:hypothetical protein
VPHEVEPPPPRGDDTEPQGGLARAVDSAVFWLAAVGLTLTVWWPLWRGAGLQGGDLYTYYFPFKAWYAERLQAGELPLWNPRVGHGFPAVGESQTGVFYPFHLLAYRLLPLNTAYHASFLLHYVLAFGFACEYLRRLVPSRGGVLLGAFSLVYGWFPARSCLEWAIVTGAWLPGTLWAVEAYLTEGRRRWLILVQVSLLMQLLAGHFHLSFVTLLLVTLYAPLRGWVAGLPAPVLFQRLGRLATAMALALGLAGIQLVPSFELKGRSQRSAGEFRQHQVAYGNIPPAYLGQFLQPWRYYPRVDHPDFKETVFGRHYTNKVEAHLYFGMLPLGLAVVALAGSALGRAADGRRSRSGRVLWVWLAVAAVGLGLVTGWWVGWGSHVPGLSYFTGPGRYGLLVQFAVAAAATYGARLVLSRIPHPVGRSMLATALLAATGFDLAWVNRQVQIARIVADPPIHHISESVVAQLLPAGARVVSRNQNAVSLCGAATLPVYLGIGPREYFDGPLALPGAFQWGAQPDPATLRWLEWAGVSHFLAFEPMPADWPVRLEWAGNDRLLHAVLGRAPHELLWLYRLDRARPRAYWVPAASSAAALAATPAPVPLRPADSRDITANRVDIAVTTDQPATVVLTDLYYPGWRVTVDGEPATPLDANGLRAVNIPAGRHRIVWTYRPWSLVWGGVLSLGSIAATIAWLCRDRNRNPPPS